MTPQEELIPPRIATRLGGKRGGTWALAGAMSLSLMLVAALAYWDEQREFASALQDFALEQATLARSLAANLSTHLSQALQDALLMAEGDSARRPIPPSIAE